MKSLKLKYIISLAILLIIAFNQVFVITCENGHAYHKIMFRYDYCLGLRSCRSGKHLTTIFSAINSGRTKCHFCYDGEKENTSRVGN